MTFFFEVLIGGLLSGVLYALVALGFVLIYKASGVFNFAQGAMVFFAALTFVGFREVLPGWTGMEADGAGVFWMAFVLALAAMIVLGILTEKVVLRPLVNQPPITLFMATIGLTFLIEGLAQAMWGANVRGLSLGIADEPVEWIMESADILVSKFDLFAAAPPVVGRVARAAFPLHEPVDRACARSGDDTGGMSIGIPLQHIWPVVGAVAGARCAPPRLSAPAAASVADLHALKALRYDPPASRRVPARSSGHDHRACGSSRSLCWGACRGGIEAGSRSVAASAFADPPRGAVRRALSIGSDALRDPRRYVG